MTALEFSSDAFEGLSSREKLVYAALEETGETTMQRLADRLATEKPNVHKALHALSKEGLVEKRPDPTHPRRDLWRIPDVS